MAFSDAAHPLPTASADPLHALRQATQATHSLLDSRLAIGQPTASLTDYAAHARGLAAWLQALAPALGTLQAQVPQFDFTPAHRLAALQQDLQDLATLAPQTPPSQPWAWPAPSASMQQRADAVLQKAQRMGNPSAAIWGIAYVVEGSQLGGLVLHKRLAGPLAPHPLRYLRGSAEATASRWKSFIGLLRDNVATPDAMEAACDGAMAAFDGLIDEFRHTEGMLR